MRRSKHRIAVLVTVATLAVSGCGGSIAKQTVTVPKAAANTSADDAYDALHQAGLRVSVQGHFTHWPTESSIVSSIKPRVGSIVPRGSVVTVNVNGGMLGSVVTEKGRIPSAKVPDFRSVPLSAVDAWAQKHDLFWQCWLLPAFPASNRPHLLDNYVVVQQSPAPGTILQMYRRMPHGVHLMPLIVRVAVRPTG